MGFFHLLIYSLYLFTLFLQIACTLLRYRSRTYFAPADGKVVVIEETMENEYFKDMRLQVSIFMSPFNMHSNRYPVSGKVKYVCHHNGQNMVAWHPKSSELNAR